ncbi:beta-lactamase family protein [candidate division KSB1 bacterium]|nr:beta-lactamase family protein [candidate division KSB1 bacterium]
MWINGELVHANYVARGIVPRNDQFQATLKPGLNPILVKVEDRVRDWGFVLETIDAAGFQKMLAAEQARADYQAFLYCPIVPKKMNTWNYVFNPGQFPELQWEQPYLVEKAVGKFPLTIRWFDAQLNGVKTAAQPGRYAYVAEGTTPNGIKIRRAATLFCMPPQWISWGERPRAALEYLPVDFISKSAWEAHREPISYFTGRSLLMSIIRQQEGAMLLSYLHEIGTDATPPELTDTPIIRDHDYHLALKRKLLGVEKKWSPLQPPRKITDQPARVLRPGTENEAGVKSGTAAQMRTVCQQWYAESREPFIILVARHGVIIIHEAFGERPDGKVTLETTTEMASLTKLLTGLLFAQFVDQGLIQIDDPVGKFLPDFPTEGEKVLTLRHCFTHTSGLSGHEEWGGLHNPWLDNVIANQLPELPVGKKHEYNGMGYDLAGKVMEIVSGKSIFRLMRENFFDPLGLKQTILEEDLAFGCHSNAGEFAVFGQLLLNQGAYGEQRFFSPQTFQQLLPQPLNRFYPGIKLDWGIGLTWMRQTHPDAGKNGLPKGQTILSQNVIGHGSATSAILRVDLDHDLVICQTRRRGGSAYEKYLEKFLLTLESGLVSTQ